MQIKVVFPALYTILKYTFIYAWNNVLLLFGMCQMIINVDPPSNFISMILYSISILKKSAYVIITTKDASIKLCLYLSALSVVGRIIFRIYFLPPKYSLNRLAKFCWILYLPWTAAYLYFFVNNMRDLYKLITYDQIYTADNIYINLACVVIFYGLQLFIGFRKLTEVWCSYKYIFKVKKNVY